MIQMFFETKNINLNQPFSFSSQAAAMVSRVQSRRQPLSLVL
ncbi:hypothetical protein JOC37_001003 [Desulfohalotomaculum tongense]|nr:hypothetical protein [Desulforadius tongensis]